MTELRLLKGPLAMFLVGILAVGTVACGDDDSADDDGGGASGSGAAGSGGSGAGAAPLDIPDFNDCTSDAYEDLSAAGATRTIEIAPGGALEYSPKCAIISAGQTVTFSGSLVGHPLAPGDATDPELGDYEGTSPIVETDTGDSVDVTFANPGTYPYHCTFHVAAGMSGVIHVK